MPHISMELSELEKAGIVRARKLGKQKFYEKVL